MWQAGVADVEGGGKYQPDSRVSGETPHFHSTHQLPQVSLTRNHVMREGRGTQQGNEEEKLGKGRGWRVGCGGCGGVVVVVRRHAA